MSASLAAYCSGYTLLEHLDCARRITRLRLGDQQVHMFGHHHVADNHKPMPETNLFQHSEKQISPPNVPQQRQAPIAVKRDEVKMAAPVVTLEPFWHAGSLHRDKCFS